MIIALEKIDEDEMLKNWALAEVSSVRRQKYLDGMLPGELVQKIRQGQFEFTDDDWKRLTKMIRSSRLELLSSLLALKIEWYQGRLHMAELMDLEMMDWEPFVSLAGSRKLIDLVQAFQKGNMPPKHLEFAENLQLIQKEFKLEKMMGKPIMVSQSQNPPYILIEGFTRLSAILFNLLQGRSYGTDLRVILGVGKQLNEWNFF